MSDQNTITVGLTKSGRDKLRRLKENGHFSEMTDAYRFAVALALAHGIDSVPVTGERITIFNVGSLDPDGSLYAAVQLLADVGNESVYRVAEQLAEWGVNELDRLSSDGAQIPFGELLASAQQLAEEDAATGLEAEVSDPNSADATDKAP